MMITTKCPDCGGEWTDNVSMSGGGVSVADWQMVRVLGHKKYEGCRGPIQLRLRETACCGLDGGCRVCRPETDDLVEYLFGFFALWLGGAEELMADIPYTRLAINLIDEGFSTGHRVRPPGPKAPPCYSA